MPRWLGWYKSPIGISSCLQTPGDFPFWQNEERSWLGGVGAVKNLASSSLSPQVSLPLSWDSEMVSPQLDRSGSIMVFLVARFWSFEQWVLASLGCLVGSVRSPHCLQTLVSRGVNLPPNPKTVSIFLLPEAGKPRGTTPCDQLGSVPPRAQACSHAHWPLFDHVSTSVGFPNLSLCCFLTESAHLSRRGQEEKRTSDDLLPVHGNTFASDFMSNSALAVKTAWESWSPCWTNRSLPWLVRGWRPGWWGTGMGLL